jgi:signal transduction histidine kinase
LRTPLTSITGYVDLLLEGATGDLPPQALDFLGVVQVNGQRLAALINDLLEISRLEAGKMRLYPAAIDVAAKIAEVAETFRPILASRHQTLWLDVPPALPPVWADGQRTAQILANLIGNAAKFTPPSGQIDVAIQQAGEMLRVEVTDTGPGMSASEQVGLFGKFYRAPNAATEQTGGTGLGLAIAKGLVEAQGGRIGVRSETGAGATFWFTLPVAR